MHKVLLQCSDVKAFIQKKEVKDKRKLSTVFIKEEENLIFTVKPPVSFS